MALEKMKFNFRWTKDNNLPIVVPTDVSELACQREGLKNYYDFLCSIDREAAKAIHPGGSLNWVSDRFLGFDIQFVLLNTASEINCSRPDIAQIDDDEFRAMKQHIRDRRSNPQNITICVGHHPLKHRGQGQQAVSNGHGIVNALGAKGVCAYLHGHAHEYALEPLVPGKMVAAMSPTSHVNVGNSRQGFSLVTIERNSSTKRPKILRMDICEFHSNAEFQWLDIGVVRNPFTYSGTF